MKKNEGKKFRNTVPLKIAFPLNTAWLIFARESWRLYTVYWEKTTFKKFFTGKKCHMI
jgi:hypothetical protein